jgi:hypothetical protein
MKRGEFSHKETRLIHSIEKEFELFKYKTLSGSRQELFDRCNEIRFYCCIWEYFEYAEEIRKEHMEACLKCGDSVIAALYQVYMDTEYLRCERWEDIMEILEVLVRDHQKYGTPKQQEG